MLEPISYRDLVQDDRARSTAVGADGGGRDHRAAPGPLCGDRAGRGWAHRARMTCGRTLYRVSDRGASGARPPAGPFFGPPGGCSPRLPREESSLPGSGSRPTGVSSVSSHGWRRNCWCRSSSSTGRSPACPGSRPPRIGGCSDYSSARDQLDDEPRLGRAELWLDDPDDPGPAGNLEPIANLEQSSGSGGRSRRPPPLCGARTDTGRRHTERPQTHRRRPPAPASLTGWSGKTVFAHARSGAGTSAATRRSRRRTSAPPRRPRRQPSRSPGR